MRSMDVLSSILIGSLIIGAGFAVGLGLQGYFMYKAVSMMTILKSAPNVEAAVRLAKGLKLTEQDKEKVKKNIPIFNADNMPEKALPNLRKQL